MTDEVYDKYVKIAYYWCEDKKVNRGVRVYAPRKEIYVNDVIEYYVIGIGVSNFLEPDGFDEKKYEIYRENTDEHHDPMKCLKILCGSNRLTIDELYDLSNKLKEGGAPEVYLHPSFWTDNKTVVDYPSTDEWLIVIPKN